MVFIRHDKRIEFVSSKFKGSQTIKNNWQETIEYIKNIYHPTSWEIISG